MISKILNSKTFTYLMLALTIILIVATFKLRTEWWMFFDIFFIFMSVFTHLMAQTIMKIIPNSAKTLDKIAFILLILFFISIIAEIILFKQI